MPLKHESAYLNQPVEGVSRAGRIQRVTQAVNIIKLRVKNHGSMGWWRGRMQQGRRRLPRELRVWVALK
jgi:hypothetical protein